MKGESLARYYFDHAATSWPKSEHVLKGVEQFLRDCGVGAGRGGYAQSRQANNWIDQARTNIAKLIGATDPQSIGFFSSGTAALNEAIQGSLRLGDHVVTSAAEHNSVLRPLAHLAKRGQIQWDVVPCDRFGLVQCDDIRNRLRPNTKLIALTHVSNVTGAIQPIEEVGKLAQQKDILFLVDAAQSLGELPIDLSQCPVDWLAAPGHKGLGAILGTGLLYASPKALRHYQPLLFGGTGTQSEQIDADLPWPQCAEVGNQNMPGIVSMAIAAKEHLDASHSDQLHNDQRRNWSNLTSHLVDALTRLDSLKIHRPTPADGNLANQPLHTSVVSISCDRLPPQEFAAILDASFGIQCRAGLHCAGLIHAFMGTSDHGTLRLSLGRTTTRADVDYAIEAISSIVHGI